MRGDIFSVGHVPQSIKEVPATPTERAGWQVTLHPHNAEPIVCPRGETISDAYDQADITQTNQLKGES